MKDSLHGDSKRIVVGVECIGVLCAARGSELLSGGQQRPDGFVAKNDQCGEGLETRRYGLVSPCMSNPLDDLFAAQLLQIIGGVAGTVLGFALFAEDSDLMSQSEAVNPPGDGDKATAASTTQRILALLRSIPPTLVLPICDGSGSCSNIVSAMKD